jgi:hypothetical protein
LSFFFGRNFLFVSDAGSPDYKRSAQLIPAELR